MLTVVCLFSDIFLFAGCSTSALGHAGSQFWTLEQWLRYFAPPQEAVRAAGGQQGNEKDSGSVFPFYSMPNPIGLQLLNPAQVPSQKVV